MNNHSIKSGEVLPLNETFLSVQGEGYHVGKAAFFIRLGGCDVSCSWCDTKYSWQAMPYQLTDIKEIVKKVKQSAVGAVVVTGGEPTLFRLDKLTRLCKRENIKTYLETSGSNQITGTWHWICLSPKMNKPPLNSSYKLADELKVIINDLEKDFSWAEKQSTLVSLECKLYLQSEWSLFEKNKNAIIQYVQENPKWQLSVQLHKYLNIP